MYRYKAPHDGGTRHSIKGLKYINKLGKLLSIEAYTVGMYYNSINEETNKMDKFPGALIRIIVRGENGSCTFGGFSWGYSGEGPRGLIKLLKTCGMTQEIANHYATSNTLGEFNPSPNNSKLYNATTLWKFMNSDIGWNLIKNEKQVKFKKGQKLFCTDTYINNNVTFQQYFGTDYAHVKMFYNGDPEYWTTVPVTSLTII